MNALLNLSAAFGLSGAAGLNAYIPLLLLSILTNRGIVHLHAPYDVLGAPWCIAILAVLCIVELVVDKVPGADHVNDVVQSFVRPTAGAILFASQAGTMYGIHPGVWITIGLLFSGSVHATKMAARPVVNIATFGIGGPVVSAAEDLVSAVVSLLALLAPIFVVAAMFVFGVILFKAFRQCKSRPRASRVDAVPAPVTASRVIDREFQLSSVGADWRGGL